MEIFIVNQVRHEFDCGDFSADIISAHTSYEDAMKAFKQEEAVLMSEDWEYKIKNDHQYNWSGHIIYKISYQNYCSNLVMQIERLNINVN